MKKIFPLYFAAMSLFSNAQHFKSIENRDFIKSINVGASVNSFSLKRTATYFKFSPNESAESLLIIKPNFKKIDFQNKLGKINIQIDEKKIDYDQLTFSCRGVRQIESRDLMISAFKHYVLNKYVFSLISNTEYD